MYDVNLGKESATGQLSAAEKQISDQEKYPYFSKSICSNLDAKHFATFYHTRPVFKIYDQDGVLLKEVTIIHPDTSSDDPTKLYFTDAFTTDKHIYAMWIGKNKNEIGLDLNAFRPEIMIFDWDGNLKERLKLDRPIITCTVSEENGELYAVSFIEDDCNKIIRYKL